MTTATKSETRKCKNCAATKPLGDFRTYVSDASNTLHGRICDECASRVSSRGPEAGTSSPTPPPRSLSAGRSASTVNTEGRSSKPGEQPSTSPSKDSHPGSEVRGAKR